MKDEVAVIIGASKGIGAEASKVFASVGIKVVLAARDEKLLSNVVNEIKDKGGDAIYIPTDVNNPNAVENLINETVEHYGKLDFAFNNQAGGGHRPMPFADVPIEAFDSSISVNLRGTFLAMKFEIPEMLKNGGGAIVNMSSTAGVRGVKGISAYAAGKHGIIGLTKVAALDYAQQNIRINVVTPGPILTHNLEKLDPDMKKNLASSVPIHRLGNPGEVAETILWLCSDQASFITGAVIPIDGGQLAAL